MSKVKVQIDKDLEDLIPGYLKNREKDIVDLKSSIENKNFELIKTIGHKLKGNAATYGFIKLGEIGALIEISATNSDIEKIKSLLDEYEKYLSSVEIEFVQS